MKIKNATFSSAGMQLLTSAVTGCRCVRSVTGRWSWYSNATNTLWKANILWVFNLLVLCLTVAFIWHKQ